MKKKTKTNVTKIINIIMAVVLLASIVVPMIIVLTSSISPRKVPSFNCLKTFIEIIFEES